MEEIVDLIREYSVEIKDGKNELIGSGVIYVPEDNINDAYIYTVAHVALKIKENEEVLFGFIDERHINSIKYNSNDIEIIIHNGFDIDNKERSYYDIAIIKIRKEQFMVNLEPWLTILPQYGDRFIMCGYPESVSDKDNILDRNKWEIGSVKEVCKELERGIIVSCDNMKDSSDLDINAHGYSGSGVFIYSDKNNPLKLIGLFRKGSGHENEIIIENPQLIDEQVDSDWCIPKFKNSIPNNFDGGTKQLRKLFEKNEVAYNVLRKVYYNKYNWNINPSNLIIEEKDLYDIPNCILNRCGCDYYWAGRVLMIYILSIVGILEKDISNPRYKFGQDIINLKYICSEGDNSNNSKLPSIVNGIMKNVLYKKGLVTNNSIFIWQGINIESELYFNRHRMKYIMRDISEDYEGEYFQQANKIKYDIFDGENGEDNFAVVHIQYICTEFLNKIYGYQNLSIEESEKKIIKIFQGVLEDVWNE